MEWTELQAMWQQYDARLVENTRINKEVLKRILRSKPEKRLKRMRGWAIYGMVAPIPVMCIAMIPNTKFRNEWDFYLGLFLLIVVFAIELYKTTQYFFLIRDVDFTHQVAKTKKQLVQLDESKLKSVKLGYLFLFAAMIGVALMCQIPVITKSFIGLTIFIILLSIVTNYIHLKNFKELFFFKLFYFVKFGVEVIQLVFKVF